MSIKSDVAKSLEWCIGEQLTESEFFARFAALIQKNRSKRRQYAKTYRLKHPETSRKFALDYYHKHADRFRASAKLSRERRKNNPDRLKRYRDWCKNYVARRKKEDVHFLLKWRLRGRIKMAIDRGNLGSESVLKLVGCTIPELKAHIESQWLPGMTWKNCGKNGWHLDHIKPCASFDLTDPEQQKVCFHYSNMQPMWAFDNLSKGTKPVPMGAQLTFDTGLMLQRVK